MRFLTLPRYTANGPSSRVRFYQYFPFLEADGVNLRIKPFFDEHYIEALFARGKPSVIHVLQSYAARIVNSFHAKPDETIWLQYELLPWLPFFIERMLLDKRARLVIDYDDAVFHRYDQHSNFLVRRFLGRKIDRLMSTADVVVAGNEYLAMRARDAGVRRVEVIPSVVDLSRYPVKPYEKENGRKIRVGWLGSPTTVKYVLAIEAVIKEIINQGMEFVIIGAKKPPSLAALPITELVWSLETEADFIHSLDIGVMPSPDTPFERGKCGYKLIQYMACGIPVVASPVGVNRDLVTNGGNGFLANNLSEWSQYINKLAADSNLRRNMGQQGRVLVENDFNLDIWAPVLYQILSG